MARTKIGGMILFAGNSMNPQDPYILLEKLSIDYELKELLSFYVDSKSNLNSIKEKFDKYKIYYEKLKCLIYALGINLYEKIVNRELISAAISVSGDMLKIPQNCEDFEQRVYREYDEMFNSVQIDKSKFSIKTYQGTWSLPKGKKTDEGKVIEKFLANIKKIPSVKEINTETDSQSDTQKSDKIRIKGEKFFSCAQRETYEETNLIRDIDYSTDGEFSFSEIKIDYTAGKTNYVFKSPLYICQYYPAQLSAGFEKHLKYSDNGEIEDIKLVPLSVIQKILPSDYSKLLYDGIINFINTKKPAFQIIPIPSELLNYQKYLAKEIDYSELNIKTYLRTLMKDKSNYNKVQSKRLREILNVKIYF